MKDERIVSQLKKRNEKGLYAVIDEYGGLIKAIIRKYLYQFEHVQDECMDDILMSIWQNIDAYDARKNPLKNWIAGIAKYKAIDYLRKYQKYLDQLEIKEEMVGSTHTEIVVDGWSSRTERLLSHLKKEDQLLFLDHYAKQKSIEELAMERDVEKSVIYNRLSRGRKKLRTIYKEKFTEF